MEVNHTTKFITFKQKCLETGIITGQNFIILKSIIIIFMLRKSFANLLRAIKNYLKNIFATKIENKNKKILASFEIRGIVSGILQKNLILG